MSVFHVALEKFCLNGGLKTANIRHMPGNYDLWGDGKWGEIFIGQYLLQHGLRFSSLINSTFLNDIFVKITTKIMFLWSQKQLLKPNLLVLWSKLDTLKWRWKIVSKEFSGHRSILTNGLNPKSLIFEESIMFQGIVL